jgi:hypothetical protein
MKASIETTSPWLIALLLHGLDPQEFIRRDLERFRQRFDEVRRDA